MPVKSKSTSTIHQYHTLRKITPTLTVAESVHSSSERTSFNIALQNDTEQKNVLDDSLITQSKYDPSNNWNMC